MVEVEENEAKSIYVTVRVNPHVPGPMETFWFFEIFWNLLESCEICSNLLGSVWIFGDLGTK